MMNPNREGLLMLALGHMIRKPDGHSMPGKGGVIEGHLIESVS